MKLEINNNQIEILEINCFRCNTTKHVTKHHVIPQYLKPHQNVIIPLCRECHTILHSQDMNNIRAFLHKIQKSLDSVKGMFKRTKIKKEQITIGDLVKRK